jgi:flagellar hook-length control protein FliK
MPSDLVRKAQPMNITLGDKPSTLALTAPKTALEPSAEFANTAQGQNFGQLMTDMRLQHFVAASPDAAPTPTDGQQIADAMDVGADGLLGLQAESLKEMSLGPNLNVIIPRTAAPDAQSLEAFARAQGLDEKAVKWLFSAPAAASTALLAVGAEQAQPAETDNMQELPPIQLLRMPPPAAVWMQRGLVNGVLQEAVTAPPNPKISVSELDLGTEWGPDLLNDLLNDLLPPEGTTSQGGSTTGTQGTAYANFAARWDAQAPHRSDVSHAGNSAPAELNNTSERSESIQKLAEKMGQAVGQRILSEMERGQWHLKLQLRPATLGHIEVEMRMRSGEFDAVFIAPNTTTRDLLQEGMTKLRETLSQMGMDVASIHVGGGQTGQSGGEPTPGFSKGKPTQAKESGQETTTEKSRAPRVQDPHDGLDVLV